MSALRSHTNQMEAQPAHACRGPFRDTAQVHPADAARVGLASAAGSVQVHVELRDALTPGVASLPHGCGHGLPGPRLAVASLRTGANLKLLLDGVGRDPLSGNAVLNGAAARLAPV